MTDDEKKTERKKLTVTQVKEVEHVGTNQIPKLSFKAKDGEEELWYFSFRTSLFDAIKKEEVVDVDVETSSRNYEGNIYVDRKVFQVYVDGQPLGGKKQGRSFGGKSPEEIASIEAQVAVKLIVELRIAEIIDDKHPLYKTMLDWCSDKVKPSSTTVRKETTNKPSLGDALFGEEETQTRASEVGSESKTPSELDSKREDLFQWVADKKGWKDAKTVRTWLVNALKIPEEEINTNPNGVAKKVKELTGWEL